MISDNELAATVANLNLRLIKTEVKQPPKGVKRNPRARKPRPLLTATFEILEPKEEPREQGFRFYLTDSARGIYTILGAKNIHHAYNKAAKLYKDKWTCLSNRAPDNHHWKLVPVTEF